MSTASTSGSVACELSYVSSLGASLLKAGGSAADAIIATVLCVGVINSHHTGIGGGGFALVRTKEGKYEGVDFRNAAPAAAHPQMHAPNPPNPVGSLSVAVPGEIAGLAHLHQRYGKLTWADCLAPAIKLCEEGFEMNRDLWDATQATIPGSGHHASSHPLDPTKSYLLLDPNFRSIFSSSHVTTPYESLSPAEIETLDFLPVGSKVTRPALGKTLKTLAEKGAKEFYEGEIGRSVVDCVQKLGGVMTMDDMKNYEILLTEPLSIPYRSKYRIYSTPAPSSGSIVLSALNILGQFDDLIPVDDEVLLHRTAEAMKFAYGQRTIIGDPAFIPEVPELQRRFLTSHNGKKIKEMIRDETVLDPSAYSPGKVEIKEDRGTSHFVATDSSDLVISLTSTILLYWGSRILDPQTGIMLNDGMEDFSFPGEVNTWGYEGSVANVVEGGKRPLSSQSPWIVEGQSGWIAAGGCAGGSRIISTNVQVVRNILDYGMGAREALATPRIHHQLVPNVLAMEISDSSKCFVGFTTAQLSSLASKGHTVEKVTPTWSNACAVKNAGGRVEASGEPRRFDTGGEVVERGD